jgi:17 kDa outer membrane surface antigen
LRPPAARNVLPAYCLCLYRAWGRVGLSVSLYSGSKSAAMTLILIALSTSGCSFSRGGDGFGLFSKGDNEVTTGSIAPGEPQPTDSDLAFARTAASDVLTKGDKDSSQPWENPETGARGSVTPLAQAYATEDGRTCRDFLASYVNGKTESWLQGAACHGGNGRWEIHTLKPWRRG